MQIILAALLLSSVTCTTALPALNGFKLNSPEHFDIVSLDYIEMWVIDFINIYFAFIDHSETLIDEIDEFHIVNDQHTDLYVKLKELSLPLIPLIESTASQREHMTASFSLVQPIKLAGKFIASGLFNGEEINYNGDFIMQSDKLYLNMKLYLMIVDNEEQEEFDQFYGTDAVEYSYKLLGEIKSNFNGIPAKDELEFSKLVNQAMIKFLDEQIINLTQNVSNAIHNKTIKEFVDMFQIPMP